MKIPNLHLSNHFLISESYGIYRGTGRLPYFGGVLRYGVPAASGPGCYDGEWFRLKRDAVNYATELDASSEYPFAYATT